MISRNTRKHDIEYLLKLIENPMTSSGERRDAQEALKKISHESSLIKDMRYQLVKAMRAGKAAEVRDINEYVFGKEKYK
jgi:hypothetical protein